MRAAEEWPSHLTGVQAPAMWTEPGLQAVWRTFLKTIHRVFHKNETRTYGVRGAFRPWQFTTL